LLKQETVSGSGISWAICKSEPRSRQITTPAPRHSVFYRPDALPAAQPTASKQCAADAGSATSPADAHLSSQMMIRATMRIYEAAMSEFLPTPSKSHYIFNLRDFARVMRGVLLVPADRMTEPDKLIRLWIHEVYRVFNDRLTDDTDRCRYYVM